MLTLKYGLNIAIPSFWNLDRYPKPFHLATSKASRRKKSFLNRISVLGSKVSIYLKRAGTRCNHPRRLVATTSSVEQYKNTCSQFQAPNSIHACSNLREVAYTEYDMKTMYKCIGDGGYDGCVLCVLYSRWQKIEDHTNSSTTRLEKKASRKYKKEK